MDMSWTYLELALVPEHPRWKLPVFGNRIASCPLIWPAMNMGGTIFKRKWNDGTIPKVLSIQRSFDQHMTRLDSVSCSPCISWSNLCWHTHHAHIHMLYVFKFCHAWGTSQSISLQGKNTTTSLGSTAYGSRCLKQRWSSLWVWNHPVLRRMWVKHCHKRTIPQSSP